MNNFKTSQVEMNTEINHLKFKRAFWLLFAAIAIIQTYEVGLWILYDFEIYDLPESYYFYSYLAGILWQITLFFIIIFDIKRQNIVLHSLLNIKISMLGKWIIPPQPLPR